MSCRHLFCVFLLVALLEDAVSASVPNRRALPLSIGYYDLCSTSKLEFEGLSIQPGQRPAIAFDPRSHGRIWMAANAEQKLLVFSLGGQLEAEIKYSALVGEKGKQILLTS